MKIEFINLLKANIGKHIEGQASGFSHWLNGAVHKATDEGDIEIKFIVREDMCNPFGVLHGGAMSAILDEVMGLLLFIKSDEAATYLALGIHVDFVKAAKLDEILIATPEIIRIGRQVATVRCVLKNKEGVLIAQGSSSFLKMAGM